MIPLCVPLLEGKEWSYIKECLDTNWVSSAGGYVCEFEDRFSKYLNVNKAVATVNGTAALHLALLGLGIKPGDEVIVPSMTFISPVNAIKYVGAIPVFVDICRDTYVMDVNKIENLITERTKAILPVHIYGHPVDMDVVMDIAKRHNLYVIEDATESLGSLYKGRHTGTIGDIGCFSFNGNKLITTGAGGMLSTNNEEIGLHIKYLSNQTKSITPEGAFYHEEIGYNYRMPNILAAMGVAQLESIDRFIETKRRNALYYSELLHDVHGITLPLEKEWAQNVYWLYSIIVEDSFHLTRDELINKLKVNGIESRPFFLPVHNMPPYKDCIHGSMDITIDLSGKGINLPSSSSLSKEQIAQICNIIKGI